jgi:hypothetical protein
MGLSIIGNVIIQYYDYGRLFVPLRQILTHSLSLSLSLSPAGTKQIRSCLRRSLSAVASSVVRRFLSGRFRLSLALSPAGHAKNRFFVHGFLFVSLGVHGCSWFFVCITVIMLRIR